MDEVKSGVTVNKSGEIALFIVYGRIYWEHSRDLDRKITEAIDEGYCHIVFNLDDVTFLCSGGIGALVYHIRRAQGCGGDIYIVSNNDYVQYLFNTVCFDQIFAGKIFSTFDQFMTTVLEPKKLQLNTSHLLSKIDKQSKELNEL